MKVELREVTVQELVDKYRDDEEGGVFGYGGRLDIRPPFQREFIYKDKERDAVVHSVMKGFPLNVMYWADREDGRFEIIDGQQRTISLAQYVKGVFSLDGLYFHNLPTDKQDVILDYELMVYVCTGTDSEKLEWFKTINIAGQQLTDQELRNAVYSGPWVSDAKRYFSRSSAPAYGVGRDHLKGVANRQDYLQTAIKWISGGKIQEYMARHQHDRSAEPLWEYLMEVIDWVKATFKTRPKMMRGVDWGWLHREYGDQEIDAESIEEETRRLIDDEDVQKQSGIYAYILTGNEQHLGIRRFPDQMKRRVYEKQDGRCTVCGEEFEYSEMEADHIKPWVEGGQTIEENCQMLCRADNRRKGAK